MKKILIIEDDMVFGREHRQLAEETGDGMPPCDGTGSGKESPCVG